MEYVKAKDKYMIRLDKDDCLFTSLLEFAETENLSSGQISGIGALKNVEMGFYHLEEKKYYKKVFLDAYELLSMSGNLSLMDGKPFFHLHTVLSDEEYRCWGGHLFSAQVAVTVEIIFTPVELPFVNERKLNEETGFAFWNLKGEN